MALIAPVVGGHSRVCVYDRAGRGWSEPAPSGVPQDGAQIVADLHTLLQRGNVPGPYVLAGHSFGGLYVRTFAARYPTEVAGLVLVDSTGSRTPAKPSTPSPGNADSYNAADRVSILISISARLGLARLIGMLPPRSPDEVLASSAKATTVRSTIDEYVAAGDSAREAAALQDFGDKPLVVVTATVGNSAGWMRTQNQSAKLSTNSVHRVIPGATHEALIVEQKYAAATTQAILDVVTAVRNGAQLNR
jgi:pimeloyl-ACP methyl ester carboxylesterase